MFRRRAKPRTLVLSSLLAGCSLAAFAIYVYGVEVSALTKALAFIVIVFLSISIPAAALLLLCKLIAHTYRKLREKE